MGKKLFGVLWAVLLVSVMVGRCYAATPEKKKIVLGVRADIIGMYEAIKPELDVLGYEIEMKSFNDSIQPNQALAEGSIDVNWYQHEQYMRSYNEANKTNFVMIRPKTYGNLFAMYSMKWGTLDKLPEGALIGLCNDDQSGSWPEDAAEPRADQAEPLGRDRDGSRHRGEPA